MYSCHKPCVTGIHVSWSTFNLHYPTDTSLFRTYPIDWDNHLFLHVFTTERVCVCFHPVYCGHQSTYTFRVIHKHMEGHMGCFFPSLAFSGACLFCFSAFHRDDGSTFPQPRRVKSEVFVYSRHSHFFHSQDLLLEKFGTCDFSGIRAHSLSVSRL